MKALVCEMCGSHDLIKKDGYYYCEACGTKYSLEEAKKLLVEVSGTVAIDKSKELENLYSLARRARDEMNSANAEKYYNQILAQDPESWEANFYSVYYQTMNCKIGQIGSASMNLLTNLTSTFNLIEKNAKDQNEKFKAFKEISGKLISISRMLFNGARSHFDGIGESIRSKYSDEFIDRCIKSTFLLSSWGGKLEKYDSDIGIRNNIIECYKTKIDLFKSICSLKYYKYGVNVSAINAVCKDEIAYIQKYESNYQPQLKQQAETALNEQKNENVALVFFIIFCIFISFFISSC